MKGISKFLSAAIAAQSIAAITGLLLAHWLTVDEYAIYTVVTMMTGAMMVLTKGGVNLGLNAILGRVWPDLTGAKKALYAALIVRRKIALFVLPIILFFSSWLLIQNGASDFLVFIMILLLCANFIFDFHSRLHDQIIFFANKAHNLQVTDGLLSVCRLIAICILKISGLLTVSLAVFVGICMAGLRIVPIRYFVRDILPNKKEGAVDKDIEEIKCIAKRQFPLEVFYIFQGQIILVLLALYGSISDTAAVGALNRIGQLFLPVITFINAYAIPRFCQISRHDIPLKLIMWGGVALMPGLLLCMLAIIYPSVLLMLVGGNYLSYNSELFVVCFFFSFKVVSTCVWQLLANRGLNKYSYIQVPIFICWCVVSPIYLDLSSLLGVLWFQIGFPISLLVAALTDLSIEFKK